MEIILVLIGGFVIYMYASRDTRRDRAVETRVRRMLTAGREYAVFNDIYFEAARAYAIAKGCSGRDQDAASADIMIDGRAISVTFLRDSGGGTTFMTESVSTRDARLDKTVLRDIPPARTKPVEKQPTTEDLVDILTSTIMELNARILLLPDSEYAQLFRRLEAPIILNHPLSDQEMAHYARQLMIYATINARMLAAHAVEDIIGDAGANFRGDAEGSDLIVSMLLRGLEMISRGVGEGGITTKEFKWVDFRSVPKRLDSILSKFTAGAARARA